MRSKLLIVYLEERFTFSSDGAYGGSTVYGDGFWDRYLSVYESILIVARARRVEKSSDVVNAISNPKIKFHAVPYYEGPINFLKVMPAVFYSIGRAVKEGGVHLLRLPGTLGSIAYLQLKMRRKSFGVELVGDPAAVFGAAGVGGVFARFYKRVFTTLTHHACIHAKAVAYVTKNFLQEKYPFGPNAFATHYSSIQLAPEMIRLDRSIDFVGAGRPFIILAAGSMAQRYKGFDVLIRAVLLLELEGVRVELQIAGDGAHRGGLEELASKIPQERVKFLGVITRSELMDRMDRANLFVMPSRTEGLPRVLIEAMARGLPAIGSDVGGIPELLPIEFLFESENETQLAQKIKYVRENFSIQRDMSQRNLRVASEYESSYLTRRRDEFYHKLCGLEKEGGE
ncbi:glycosyltransferase family 4 protein [Variovorax boronicumulans]|uniref:glycosyltransferase family 4 protein n=1 Tax=Variovorax boronicumulans TaxID=436515 RepID=UPI001C56DE39